MSLEKKTDKIIRDKLKQHASPLPAHLWEGLDAILESDKKRKRGGFWWWSGGAALLLVFVTAGYFMLMRSDADHATTNMLSTTTATAKDNTVDDIQETKTSETSSTTDNQNTKNSTNNTTPAVANASNVIAAGINPKAETPKNQNTKKKALASINPQANSTSSATPTIVNADVGLLQIKEDRKTSSIFDADIPGVKVFEKMAMPVGLQIDSQDALLEDRSLEDLDWPSFINKDPKCARFGKWLRLYFYADAYFSPDMAFRTLKPKHADYYEYSQMREDTESRGISYSTGVRFSVVSNHGWAARTGIVYSQINEKFDYESESEVRTTIRTIKEPNGDFIRFDTLVEYGSRFKTTYNHYKMIDIPLIVGYEVNFKKKLSMSLNGGVYFNIMSRQKGDFLSPEYQVESFTSEGPDPYPAFKNRLNLSLYGSVGFMYNMTDHWQILLEPQIRYYMDPLTNRSYMVEQSYFSTGLITGLRYKF